MKLTNKTRETWRNTGRAMLGAADRPAALGLGGCGVFEEGEAYIYGMESWVCGYPLLITDVIREVLTAVPAPNVDGTAAPIVLQLTCCTFAGRSPQRLPRLRDHRTERTSAVG